MSRQFKQINKITSFNIQEQTNVRNYGELALFMLDRGTLFRIQINTFFPTFQLAKLEIY